MTEQVDSEEENRKEIELLEACGKNTMTMTQVHKMEEIDDELDDMIIEDESDEEEEEISQVKATPVKTAKKPNLIESAVSTVKRGNTEAEER